ncbi:unnamed protein product [Chrysodeixis includens]|uniref:Uncharacterized protein n=1 Tax=Chrysodeixis includens TaxID=689277 RepID=A0A9N8L346_CHRIL|nr:unnamed protein product [Chrysodeixis includens]
MGFNYSNYEQSLKCHNFNTLEVRRDCVDVILLYKIINNVLDVPLLLHNISIRVPRGHERRCRKKDLFCIPKCKTSYCKNMFIRRACKLYNDSDKLFDIDIFCCTLNSIKKAFN